MVRSRRSASRNRKQRHRSVPSTEKIFSLSLLYIAIAERKITYPLYFYHFLRIHPTYPRRQTKPEVVTSRSNGASAEHDDEHGTEAPLDSEPHVPRVGDTTSVKSEPVVNFSNILVPPWFLENCVKTSEEMKNFPTRLALCDHDEDNKCVPELGPATNGTHVVEIDTAVYRALYLVRQLHLATVGTLSNNHDFGRKSLYLRYPDHVKLPENRCFFQAVVELYAKEIGAHLITLETDDILDLAQHFASSAERTTYIDADSSLSLFFELASVKLKQASSLHALDGSLGYLSSTQLSSGDYAHSTCSSKYQFPFFSLLEIPLLKGTKETLPQINLTGTPLLVHIPDIHHYESPPPDPHDVSEDS
ncbi:hypothetical protein CC86DRAFT_388077 [Ophiobolus disseminans]|uniref:Uncharacterized protein n=1 Tax=Ophiobolus disseminans TaxID=1469910 RepID=A0A6A6ZG26_9PLEO|nr:hypothetical protein CC86DRAFT_388077 [Ophiobolus disseminans]